MPELSSLMTFAFVALGLVLTPGPNMIYLTSRSICQGRRAGLISLGGVALGFVFICCARPLGITALIFAVPYAYDICASAGVVYLLYLAWQAIKPGGCSPFAVRDLPADGPRKLFLMGFITSVANPKIAIMYLSLLPQFISPGHGSILSQSLVLGFTQAFISVAVNALIVLMAGEVSRFLTGRPLWQRFQRWLMATVLAGMAVKNRL
ncbi:Leucine efflux protein [Raoultella terrigena]|uniref:Leucine efflux protein n=1 Tax=Raoultella terrigena TaxID=577 RepID=A0A3P8JKM9_RAOTE|nr:Leucine efflux protein [Raoultella terrigena]